MDRKRELRFEVSAGISTAEPPSVYPLFVPRKGTWIAEPVNPPNSKHVVWQDAPGSLAFFSHYVVWSHVKIFPKPDADKRYGDYGRRIGDGKQYLSAVEAFENAKPVKFSWDCRGIANRRRSRKL